MDTGSGFRSTRSGSFSIADILNKNPCKSTGNFSFQTHLPEMNSETTTKSEKHVAKVTDKLDSEDNSVQGKQYVLAEIDTDRNLVKGKVLNHLLPYYKNLIYFILFIIVNILLSGITRHRLREFIK